jgi:hypothetical protein
VWAQAAEQSVSSRRATNPGGTLGTRRSGAGVPKVAASHRVRRTRAMAAEKVGAGLAYPAAIRIGQVADVSQRSAHRVTQANKPTSSGVGRWMARLDPCGWVSTPRWARAAWKVVSTDPRQINPVKTWRGVAPGRLQQKLWGSTWPRGSRTTSQRSRTGRLPVRYPRAVPVRHSMVRGSPAYPGTVKAVQSEVGSSSWAGGLGSVAPLTRGRPTGTAYGALSQAASRSQRATKVTGRWKGWR